MLRRDVDLGRESGKALARGVLAELATRPDYF